MELWVFKTHHKICLRYSRNHSQFSYQWPNSKSIYNKGLIIISIIIKFAVIYGNTHIVLFLIGITQNTLTNEVYCKMMSFITKLFDKIDIPGNKKTKSNVGTLRQLLPHKCYQAATSKVIAFI
jgi:hypothetical protein